MITQQRLKELFDYNPDTGIFINKVRRGRCHAGTVAGHCGQGYFRININKKLYLAHRLAWLYVYGDLPQYIDHINRIPTDNRICNLRAVSKKQNQENKEKQANNKSGYKGVSWDTQKKSGLLAYNTSTRPLGLVDTKTKKMRIRLIAMQQQSTTHTIQIHLHRNQYV